MAFNIVGQLQLQGPTNVRQVVNQIQSQLRGINAVVNISINSGTASSLGSLNQQLANVRNNLQNLQQSSSNANSSLNSVSGALNNVSNAARNTATSTNQINLSITNTTKNLRQAADAAESFGRAAGLAARRYSAFLTAGGAILSFIQSVREAFKESLSFEKEMIRLEQVSGGTKAEIADTANEVTRLATTFGVSSKDLSQAAVSIAAAGYKANEAKQALEALAKASLAPSFDKMSDTVEGAIAAMAQFNIGTKDLQGALGSINQVSNQFAVESKDLIEGIRRAGGAFKIAGGDFNEFLALFTTIRSTTREGAESIGAGLRSIFTRLQRPQVIQDLEDLGIHLRYTRQEAAALGQSRLESQFVGPYEAVKRLGEALKDLPAGDPRLTSIVEQLGGLWQVSRVIPLIQQLTNTQKAYNAAQYGQFSLDQDAATAQQATIVRLTKLREQFYALFRTISESEGFRTFLDIALKLGSALVKLTESLTPLIPLLGAIATVKAASSLASFSGGFLSGIYGQASSLRRAYGGIVPGSGDTDSVPAMLTPGEFVLRKSAVQAIGPENLYKLNARRYAGGGGVFGGSTRPFITEEVQPSSLLPIKDVAGVLKGTLTREQLEKGLAIYEDKTLTDAQKKAAYAAAGVPPSGTEVGQAPYRQVSEGKAKGLAQQQETAGQVGKDFNIPFPGDTLGMIFKGSVGQAGLGRSQSITVAEIGSYANKAVKPVLQQMGIGRVSGVLDKHVLHYEHDNAYVQNVESKVNDVVKSIFKSEFPESKVNFDLRKSDLESMSGFLFERYIAGLADTDLAPPLAGFDFPVNSLQLNKKLSNFIYPTLGAGAANNYFDVKLSGTGGNPSLVLGKYLNLLLTQGRLGTPTGTVNPQAITGVPSPTPKASGGGIYGSDSVPALLTPGEFVINREAASSIGLGTLNALNNVQRFATGGPVQDPRNYLGALVEGPRRQQFGVGELSGLFAEAGIPGKTQAVFDKVLKSAEGLGISISPTTQIMLDMKTIGGRTVIAFAGFEESLLKAAKENRDAAQKQQIVANRLQQQGASQVGAQQGAAQVTAIGMTSPPSAIPNRVADIAAERGGQAVLNRIAARGPRPEAPLTSTFEDILRQRTIKAAGTAGGGDVNAVSVSKRLDLLNTEAANIQQQLIEQESIRLRGLRPKISSQERLRIAEENVLHALQEEGASLEVLHGGTVRLARSLTTASSETGIGDARLTEARNLLLGKGKGGPGASDADKRGTFNNSIGAAALGLGVLSSYAPSLVNKAFGVTASNPNAVAAGTGGAIQGIGTGVASGLVLGGPFAVIGGIIGGLTGLSSALDETATRIHDNKIQKNLDELGNRINDLANNLSGVNTASISNLLNETQNDLAAKAIKSTSQFIGFTGGGFGGYEASGTGFLGLPLDVYDPKKAANEQKALQKDKFGPYLPQMAQTLERSAQEVGSRNLNANINGLITTFENGNAGLNHTYLQIIASLKGVPISELINQFRKSIVNAQQQTLRQQATDVAKAQTERLFNTFTLLVGAVDAAINKLGALEITSKALEGTFEGTIRAITVTRPGELNNVGFNTAGFREAVVGTTAPLGAGGTELRKTAFALGEVQRLLPQALSATLSNPHAFSNEGQFGQQVRNIVTRQLGTGNESVNLILEQVVNRLNNKKNEEITKAGRGDVTKLVDDLLVDFAPVQKTLQDISKRLEENANTFINGLASFFQRLQVIGQEEDKVVQIQVSRRKFEAQIQAEKAGRRGDVLSFFPLSEQLRPIQARQERLTGLVGAAANDPNEIFRRLTALRPQITAAAQAQQEDLDKGGRIGAASEELARLQFQSASLQQALKGLADVSERNAAIQERLNRIEQDRESRLNLGERFLTASPEQRLQLNRGVILATAAAQRGNLNQFSDQQRQDILGFLNSAGQARLTGLGGATARDIKETLIKNTFGGVFDITPESRKEEGQLQEAQRTNFATGEQAQSLLVENLSQTNNELLTNLYKLQESFFANLSKEIQKLLSTMTSIQTGQTATRLGELRGATIARQRLTTQYGITTPDQYSFLTGAGSKPFEALSGAITKRNNLSSQRDDVLGRLSQINVKNYLAERFDPNDPNSLPKNVSALARRVGVTDESSIADIAIRTRAIVREEKGSSTDPAAIQQGRVARAFNEVLGRDIGYAGNDVFSRKIELQKAGYTGDINRLVGGLGTGGLEEFNQLTKQITDTKVSFDKLNEALIATQQQFNALQINVGGNQGQVGPRGFALGGFARGSDTVPAMLTPGEFIVSKDAAMQNRSALEFINRGGRYYAFGGEASSINNNVPIGPGIAFGAPANADVAGGVANMQATFNSFALASRQLSEAISRIPTSITIQGRHDVNVVFNGLEVLNALMPSIQGLIAEKTNAAINNLITTKMPDVGRNP
jgi:TP901 family phage tail tape measure protein